eukprot:COSAG05_NODE_7243_length_838_cov_0.729364_1_plen_207_part_01
MSCLVVEQEGGTTLLNGMYLQRTKSAPNTRAGFNDPMSPMTPTGGGFWGDSARPMSPTSTATALQTHHALRMRLNSSHFDDEDRDDGTLEAAGTPAFDGRPSAPLPLSLLFKTAEEEEGGKKAGGMDLNRAAKLIQDRFRKVKEIETSARFVKVLTRRLQIREPVGTGQLPEDGRVLGELVVRCVWQQVRRAGPPTHSPPRLVQLYD